MLRSFFKRYWKQYLVGFALLMCSSWLTLLAPEILGDIVDALSLGEIDPPAVYRLIGWMIAAAVGAFITKFSWRYFLIGSARDMECLLRRQLYEKFLRLPLSFYHDRKTGDLMAYAINDVNAIRMAFGPAMAQLLNGVFVAGVSIWRMVTFDCVPLVIATLAPISCAVVVIVVLGGRIRARFTKVQQTFSAISDRMQESITGIRVIKAFVQEESEAERFAELNRQMRDVNMAMIRLSALLTPLIQIFFGLSVALSLYIGSMEVRAGNLTLGDFVAFQGYVAAILAPVISIGRIINLYQRGIASWARMTDILARDDAEAGAVLAPGEVKGGIRLTDLSFTYPGGKHPALSHVSVNIAPGEKLGVMGATGSGKSTLAQLLLGLYPPPEGTVAFDGIPMEDWPYATLRDAVGYVPQDDFLFSASIADNLTVFGQTQGDMAASAEAASIAKRIDTLPQGYDTMLGERGVNLSCGQRQRLAIARALMRKPRILILDDAMSSVDTKTEEKILASLEEVQRDITAIVIAHRVSTLRGCDRIMVLDKGRVAELGTHEELMAIDGIYAAQYRQQTRERGETA